MRGGSSFTSTLYLRFMRSTTISTCMLPTPEIRSCLVSGSKWWWTVGSSSAMRASAVEILSSSPRVLGWMAKEMAGSGNVIRGSSNGCASSLSVSPVCVSLSFWATPISPGPSASTFFCVLPWSHETCPMRSRAPRAGFSSVESARSVPLITRKSDSLPMCGSLSVLNTSAVTGSLGVHGPRGRLLGLEVGAGDLAAVGRRRELVDDQVEQRVDADGLGRGGAQDGHDLALRRCRRGAP